jgi:hypothetical protein
MASVDQIERGPTLTVHNAGATALRWQASSSAGWLAVARRGGSLAPGASAQVMLTANRTGGPEGQLRATAVVDAGGVQRQVAVQAGVERDPSVSASVAPTGIRTLSLCGATTARITDTISDESALGSVVLEWGDPVTRTAMSHQGGTWQADVGRVNRAQTLSWRVVATDARGNTGDGNRAGRRMPGHRLIGTSRPCPKRYRCPSGPPNHLVVATVMRPVAGSASVL